MKVLSITNMKTSPIRKGILADSVSNEFIGSIDACHLPAGLAPGNLKSQGPDARPNVEYSSSIRHACEIHQQRGQDSAPTAHESVISFGIAEHH